MLEETGTLREAYQFAKEAVTHIYGEGWTIKDTLKGILISPKGDITTVSFTACLCVAGTRVEGHFVVILDKKSKEDAKPRTAQKVTVSREGIPTKEHHFEPASPP